jgi:hypothetical protein
MMAIGMIMIQKLMETTPTIQLEPQLEESTSTKESFLEQLLLDNNTLKAIPPSILLEMLKKQLLKLPKPIRKLELT